MEIEIADSPSPRKRKPDADAYEPSFETPKSSRISVAVDADGHVDFTKLRGDTKARLRDALSTPEAKSELLGVTPEPMFSDQDVQILFGALSQIEQLVVRVAMKVPSDIAAEAFQYTANDLVALTPPAQNLLAKYSPAIMSNNKDLIAFSLIMMGVTRRQFEQMQDAVRARKQSEAMKQRVPEMVA